jgi:CheY-like chemotaxis protein
MDLNNETVTACAKSTVLLIDDNQDVLYALEELLVTAGHIVVTKPDASSALAVVNAQVQIDVIVTDYVLPHMNGLEFLGKVRDSLPRVPVIVLTGHESTELLSKCMN